MIKNMSKEVFYILFIVFFVYFLILTVYYTVLCVLAFIQNRKFIRQWSNQDLAITINSDFVIPVSIIVPAHNEEKGIADCVNSLLNLNYPEYEIIVVDNDSTDGTIEVLKQNFGLQPVEEAYQTMPRSGQILKIYKSQKYPNITVISQSGLRKAGALNAGLGFARHRYLCLIDADTIFEPDSLSAVMSYVQRDPEKVIGVGSYFGLVNGFKVKSGRIIERSFSYNLVVAFQNLEYIRAFIGNRLSWSRFNANPIISGGFGLWRKDILIELGGYDPDFSCEDIEFTFRVQDYIARNNKDFRILSLPFHVGWTEGPENLRSLIVQRKRWQRVTHETIWQYRQMLFNPKYKWFGMVTFPYFVFYEVFGVFFEISSIVIVAWAWFSGLLGLKTFLVYLVLMILVQALLSISVLMVFFKENLFFPLPYAAYLVFLSFWEFIAYRWAISIAKVMGTIEYFRAVRTFEQS